MLYKKILAVAAVAVFVIVGLLSADTFGVEYSSDIPDSNVSPGGGFVKFAGIDGESKDSDHDSWSDLLGIEQSHHVPESAGASGMSRRRADVDFESIVVVKEVDKASPKLAEAVCKGTHFSKVEIELTRSFGDRGNLVYLRYELANARVTSYTLSSDNVNYQYPQEVMTVDFEEIKMTYTEYDSEGKSKGNVEYSWKIEEGE